MTIEEQKIENRQCQSPGRFLSLYPQILTFDTGGMYVPLEHTLFIWRRHHCCCEQLQNLGLCSALIAFESGCISSMTRDLYCLTRLIYSP